MLCAAFLVAALVLFATAPSECDAAPRKIVLTEAELKDFSSVPAPVKLKGKPSFEDSAFPLEKAVNLKEVEEVVGKLTKAQREALQKNRFILLPKKSAYPFPSHGMNDEMLSDFVGIGGFADPSAREPWNTRLVNPDVFLHALHTFFSKRLEAMEGGELLAAVEAMLDDLYATVIILRGDASKKNRRTWERLQAQILIPLILVKNCYQDMEDKWVPPDEEPEDDTLENALALMKEYIGGLSKNSAKNVAEELRRIYAADTAEGGLLGLIPAYASASVDYTQFTPRGHYERSSRSRAYFRTMIWLGQLGWRLADEDGAADALNFALAMSKASYALDEWKRVMEVSCFFVGYPDAASYVEWIDLLLESAGVKSFDADTCGKPASIERIIEAAEDLAPSIPHFSDLFSPSATEVLCIFPQRFTIPWLISDRLTYKREVAEDLPVLFSSLWVAALAGNEYATDLLPEQVPLSVQSLPAVDEEGAPSDRVDESAPKEYLKAVVEALPEAIEALREDLDTEPESAWFSSIGAAWMHLLGTLASDYGKGYPLYMQSPLFAAKQLEAQLGSYTELRHDTILYEKPNYAELGDGWNEEPPNPLPMGLIEPNLPFWGELLRVVDYIADGFEENYLFERDLEEYGALTMFRDTVERCGQLAAKQLQGKKLTEEEYEFIRLFDLDYMAAAADGYGGIPPVDVYRSALVVDIQTVNLDPMAISAPAILYQAVSEPSVMLALVGNENTPRVLIGMAFDHREFTGPHGRRLTDSMWKKRVYDRYDEYFDIKEGEHAPLPEKNFWYDGLRP